MPRPRTDIAPRIVKAARARFVRVGVDGASLRSIAKGARTSVAMVRYYFPKKDDLFLAVVEEPYVALLRDLETALGQGEGFEARVTALYERFAVLTDSEVEMLRLVAREALTSTERLGRLIERFKRGHVPLMIGLVMQARARGEIQASLHPLIPALGTILLGALPQLALRALRGRLPLAPPPSEELPKMLVRVLLHGIE